MTLRNEIDSILRFKNWLDALYRRPAATNASLYFRRLLSQQDVQSQIQQLIIPHVADSWARNYFNCSLLSVLFENEGRYELDLWLDFINSIHPVLANVFPSLGPIAEPDILEFLAMHSVNKVWRLSRSSIWAVRVNSTSSPTILLDDYKDPALNQAVTDRILKRIKVVMKKRGTQGEEVWGDNDVIVVASPDEDPGKADVFCIISCKTSLRERVYQSVFWSTHSRLEGVGRHTFLTLDKGSSGASEIGNEQAPTRKARTVIESTFDRVYVLRRASEVSRSYVIKDFEYLRTDLCRWRDDYFGL